MLHGDAVEVGKTLEVAATLNSFDNNNNNNDQMKSIEGRVNSSKQELNIAEVGCKKRYKK